ncbi:MAG: carbohydrate binding domain-containing protein, partial [Planctomycetota bacterium]
GDGGHIKAQGNNLAGGFIEVGTMLIVNRCVFMNGNAEDDGGAIQATADGIVVRIDSCWFEGNTSWDNGNVLQFPDEDQNEATVTNCVFMNNITNSDNSPDRMIETRRNSKFINCTFVGNNQNDQDLIYNNANDADGDDDGTDDEFADTTQVVNCIFVNNVVGGGDDVLGSRNDNFTIAATNCLFFGNTLQNGDPADNTQRPDVETGSVLSDPLLDADLVPGAGSEAIDGGVDPATVGVTLTNDYNGASRPQGAAYDIGAFEVGADNLLANGSFEEDEPILDDPDWVQWCTWNPAEGAGSNTTIVDTDAADGARSLRVEPVGPENWHFILVNISFAADLSKNYTASFWAKAEEPRPLTVQMKASDNSVDAWGATDFELTTDWAEYSYTSEVLHVDVKLEFLCAGTEVSFLLDLVSVSEAD